MSAAEMSSSIFMLYWAVGLLILIFAMRSDKFMREWASDMPPELDAMSRDALVIMLTVLLMAGMLLWPFIVLRRREK